MLRVSRPGHTHTHTRAHTEHKHAGWSTEHHRDDTTPPHTDTDGPGGLGPDHTQRMPAHPAPCLPWGRPCGCHLISALQRGDPRARCRTPNGHTLACRHIPPPSLDVHRSRFDTHRELALVYSVSKTRIYKGQPRSKYQTRSWGRSTATDPGAGLDSRGGSWRGGGRCRSCRPGATRLLPGVCARGSALHPSESGEGLPEMGLSSRHHQNSLPKGSSKPTSRGPTPSPARPVSAAQSRHLLQKVLPTTVWAPGVQGLGERTEWRSKGPVASVWSELSLRGSRQCGSPGPAPPRHPPETRLGKACRRKAIRSHGPRSPQERERAAPWPVPHGGLVPAVPCPTEGGERKATGEQAGRRAARPIAHRGERLTSLGRCSFSLVGAWPHPRSDAGSQGVQSPGNVATNPEEPPVPASLLGMSRYRKSEGQRTNIKKVALPSDLPTSTYLVRGDRWLPRLFP